MKKIVAKFYKVNNFNKSIFIVNTKIDENTYEYFSNLYDKIEDSETILYNPIYVKENSFFITCNVYGNDQLLILKTYDLEIELRKYEDKYINIYISKFQKLKDSYLIVDLANI